MAALPSTLQQQLAEVEEAARQAGLSVLVQAAGTGCHDVLAHLLRTTGGGGGGGGGAVSREDRSAAFLEAAAQGHDQCLRVLLDASPPSVVAELLDVRDAGAGLTALMLAVVHEHDRCVELLLQHSPDAQLAAVMPGGTTAAIIAATWGRTRSLQLMLQHNPAAQVAAVTPWGATAATAAARRGRLSCLQLLLQHSPPVQRPDLALSAAVSGWGEQLRGQHQGVPANGCPRLYQGCVELLLSKGAMLTADASPEAFALVRPVIQDLAARALVADMANAAAAQAVRCFRAAP